VDANLKRNVDTQRLPEPPQQAVQVALNIGMGQFAAHISLHDFAIQVFAIRAIELVRRYSSTSIVSLVLMPPHSHYATLPAL
jgi:hypothetical protein